MARLWTFGVEETHAVADFTPTITDFAASDLSVVTDVVHGGLRAVQFNQGTQSYFSRSLTGTKTSGTLFHRLYFYFRDFALSPTGYGAILRLTDNTGATRIKIEFQASTKTLRLDNEATGSASFTNGSAVVASGKWYRLELSTVIATDTTGSVTYKLFDGESATPLETVTQAATATMPVGNNYLGNEFGNRAGASFGTLVMDDLGMNDESGTFQNTWLGPGKIEMLVPASTTSQQWVARNGVSSPDSTVPNMLIPNELVPNMFVPPPTSSPNDAATNLDDVATASINDIDYQTSSGNSGEFDRVTLTTMQSVDIASLTLLDMYARIGGTGTGAMQLRLFDGSTVTSGPQITVPTSGYRRLNNIEHLLLSLSGRTVADVNFFGAGYATMSGTAEKRISALWVNIEYVPTGLISVSSSIAATYESGSSVSTDAQVINTETLLSTQNDSAQNYESLGSAISVSQQFTINYEFLLSVSQEL